MSSSSELKTLTNQLVTYFSLINAYLSNPSNVLPSFEDYNELLVFDEILTDAQQGLDRTASYSTGAIADTAHKVMAIRREFEMRAKPKILYYEDAEAEALNRSVSYQDMYGRYLNYFRGTSPDQAGD